MGATTVTATILGVDNQPIVGAYTYFRLTSVGTDSAATTTIDRDRISAVTDANGEFSEELWDNGDSGITSEIEIELPSGQRVDVVIPASTATIDLWNLIENYQVGSADPQLPTNQAEFLQKTSNLSDVADLLTSQQNLELEKGVDVQGWNPVLDATTASFLLADETKLDGVEALADVTDTANVTSAGALMESELASPLAVKSTTGTFLTADQTKLDGIETLADVTDVTNVTAAGALMESELASPSAVKATTGTFLTADQTKLDGIETGAEVNDPDTLVSGDIGTTVQAYNSALTGTTGTFTTADDTKLEGLKEATTTLVTTTTYTVISTDNVVLVDDDIAAGDVTITIPSAATLGDGWTFTIKKLGVTGDVILNTTGIETIDLGSSRTMRQQLEATSLCSDGSNWKVLYPSVYTGWAQYIDGQYTSGSPLSVNNAKVLLTIDTTIGTGSKIETYLPSGVDSFWDESTDRIQAQKEGDAYTIRVNFVGDPSGISDFGQIIFDIGDSAPDIPIATRTVSFAKATATSVSTTTSLFSLATFVENGCKIYFDTSDSGDSVDIYDISIVITRTHSPL